MKDYYGKTLRTRSGEIVGKIMPIARVGTGTCAWRRSTQCGEWRTTSWAELITPPQQEVDGEWEDGRILPICSPCLKEETFLFVETVDGVPVFIRTVTEVIVDEDGEYFPSLRRGYILTR